MKENCIQNSQTNHDRKGHMDHNEVCKFAMTVNVLICVNIDFQDFVCKQVKTSHR